MVNIFPGFRCHMQWSIIHAIYAVRSSVAFYVFLSGSLAKLALTGSTVGKLKGYWDHPTCASHWISQRKNTTSLVSYQNMIWIIIQSSGEIITWMRDSSVNWIIFISIGFTFIGFVPLRALANACSLWHCWAGLLKYWEGVSNQGLQSGLSRRRTGITDIGLSF